MKFFIFVLLFGSQSAFCLDISLKLQIEYYQAYLLPTEIAEKEPKSWKKEIFDKFWLDGKGYCLGNALTTLNLLRDFEKIGFDKVVTEQDLTQANVSAEFAFEFADVESAMKINEVISLVKEIKKAKPDFVLDLTLKSWPLYGDCFLMLGYFYTIRTIHRKQLPASAEISEILSAMTYLLRAKRHEIVLEASLNSEEATKLYRGLGLK